MEALEVEFTIHPLRPDQPVMKISCGDSCELIEIRQDYTGRSIINAINQLVHAQMPVIGQPSRA